MDVLVTGKLGMATEALFEKIIASHTVAVAGADIVPGRLGKKIIPFQISCKDDSFEKIFHSYNFQVAIFFGQSFLTKHRNLTNIRS